MNIAQVRGKGGLREKGSSRGKRVLGVKGLQSGLGGLGDNKKVTLGLPKNNNNNKTEMHVLTILAAGKNSL